ncbi:MAG TPA: phosphopantetheine-binding protein [Aquabacterium sp.]|uniref:acyl carrier protein n=1 Tax=Aquabacterium sp. TaxID=1872578 RepID=UPI002E35C7AA|nr:phosphopantetheine-binding protein [Aquabacterium sp.]HEX5372659.1 phosphopantetheine-binding protein [Aquabacterium sp.]
MSIQHRIIQLIGSVMTVKKTVAPSKLLVEDLGFDSIMMVELMGAVEDEFDVIITVDEASRIKTVQHLLDAVDERLPAPRQAA